MFLKEWIIKSKENKDFISKIFIILWFALALILAYSIWNIIVLLLISLFLNILFSPILNKLNKYKIPDSLWIILIYIWIFILVFLMFFAIVPIFIKQISTLISLSLEIVNNTITIYNTKWINWLWLPRFISQMLVNIDISEILNWIKNNIWEISSFVSKNLKNFLTNWAWIIFSITNAITNLILVFIFTFFIALERSEIRIFFYKIIPENLSNYLLSKETKIVDTLFSWLKSQLILWASIFIITFFWLYFIRLFWVKIDEVFTLALVAWMMEFVPYVWPFIALLPALAIALGISFKATIIILILYIIIQQIENNVLVPYVMWKTLQLSPFSVLIAMVIWASLFWIIWIIISVPFVAIIQIFLNPYLQKRKVK